MVSKPKEAEDAFPFFKKKHPGLIPKQVGDKVYIYLDNVEITKPVSQYKYSDFIAQWSYKSKVKMYNYE